MLEKHRAIESCASCHKTIDPPGFALENFDPAGGWRTRYGRGNQGALVKAGYKMADGRKFAGIHEYKKLVVSRPHKLGVNLANHLVAFGTGAPVGFSDRQIINDLVSNTADKKHGFTSILEAVVTSKIFLYK